MHQHEEHGEIAQPLSWALIVLLTAAVISWCMFIMMMVEDRPRTWDFGALPDVPAESVYSTRPGVPPFDPKQFPLQMPKLPEAKRTPKPGAPAPPAAAKPAEGAHP